jgi:hypothetical protein
MSKNIFFSTGSSSRGPEIPFILYNPEVHYCIQKDNEKFQELRMTYDEWMSVENISVILKHTFSDLDLSLCLNAKWSYFARE